MTRHGLPAHDPSTEEIYQIAGDAQGPGLPRGGSCPKHDLGTGPCTCERVRGAHSTVHMNRADRAAAVLIRFEDRIIEADLYRTVDEVIVHIICPKCLHSSKISSTRKAVEWDGTLLSVEPFECPWEMSDERDPSSTHEGVLVGSGNLCRLRMAIEKNVGRRV